MADCWSCGAERGRAAFCTECKKIQPVIRNTSYFESLGLEPRMEITRSELERAFRQRSRDVHPDRFSQTSKLERRVALEQTTHLNDAYQVLKKPRRRAEYLMKIAGFTVGTEEQRIDDPEFLMEMLELRESLESAQTYEEIQPLRDTTETRYEGHLKTLQAYFDESKGTDDEALKCLEQLRFFERFLEQVDTKFDE